MPEAPSQCLFDIIATNSRVNENDLIEDFEKLEALIEDINNFDETKEQWINGDLIKNTEKVKLLKKFSNINGKGYTE